MCVLIFCTTFVWNISRSKKNSVRCHHKRTDVCIHINYTLVFSEFNKTYVFCTDFRKKTQNVIFCENPPCGDQAATCARADGRTFRRNEARSRFAQFCAKRPKVIDYDKHRHYAVCNNFYRFLISNVHLLIFISMSPLTIWRLKTTIWVVPHS